MPVKYVHVVLPDGSAVARGSKTRTYTHAIVNSGASKSEALERLHERLNQCVTAAIEYSMNHRVLTEGALVKVEEEAPSPSGVTYETYTYWIEGLPEVRAVVYGPGDTLFDTKEKLADRYAQLSQAYRDRAKAMHRAIEYLDSMPDDYVVTTYEEDKEVASFGPFVHGFSATETNAYSRANVEARRPAYGHVDVHPVQDGKPPNSRPIGRSL